MVTITVKGLKLLKPLPFISSVSQLAVCGRWPSLPVIDVKMEGHLKAHC